MVPSAARWFRRVYLARNWLLGALGRILTTPGAKLNDAIDKEGGKG